MTPGFDLFTVQYAILETRNRKILKTKQLDPEISRYCFTFNTVYWFQGIKRRNHNNKVLFYIKKNIYPHSKGNYNCFTFDTVQYSEKIKRPISRILLKLYCIMGMNWNRQPDRQTDREQMCTSPATNNR